MFSMLLIRFAVVLFFAFSVLTGCGGSSPHTRENSDQVVVGDLRPLVLKFKTSDNLSSCDRMNLDQMLEISAAVDQHKSEIDAFAASQINNPESKVFKTVKMGPMVVREPIPGPTPKPGWQFYDYSWKPILEAFAQVKQNPTPKNWSVLNTMVRGILSNDVARILKNDAYAIGYQDEILLSDLLTQTRSCKNDSACKFPLYSADGLAWLEKQKDYSALLSDLRDSDTRAQAEKTLRTIESYISGDLHRFEMEPNLKITHSGSELRLPLYTGDLATVTTELSQYIEAVWTFSNLSLKLNWQSRPGDLFTVLLLPGTGGRSYVSYSKKQVALYNNVNTRAIAHEIGHVLGFPDHYYEVWDEAKCTYHEQYREDDLMSDSVNGKVLDEEWTTLQKTYSASAQ